MHPYTTEYVKLTEEEWLRVFGHFYSSRRRLQINFLLIGILVSIAGFAVGLNTTAGELLLLAGLGSIGGAIGDRVYLKWFLKKYVADSQNEKLFSEARAVVDETGIKSEAKTGVVSFYPWGSIIRAEDLGDLRLLYVGKLAAIVMERRAHTPEDWDSLAQWITAKVPSYSST